MDSYYLSFYSCVRYIRWWDLVSFFFSQIFLPLFIQNQGDTLIILLSLTLPDHSKFKVSKQEVFMARYSSKRSLGSFSEILAKEQLDAKKKLSSTFLEDNHVLTLDQFFPEKISVSESEIYFDNPMFYGLEGLEQPLPKTSVSTFSSSSNFGGNNHSRTSSLSSFQSTTRSIYRALSRMLSFSITRDSIDYGWDVQY